MPGFGVGFVGVVGVLFPVSVPVSVPVPAFPVVVLGFGLLLPGELLGVVGVVGFGFWEVDSEDDCCCVLSLGCLY